MAPIIMLLSSPSRNHFSKKFIIAMNLHLFIFIACTTSMPNIILTFRQMSFRNKWPTLNQLITPQVILTLTQSFRCLSHNSLRMLQFPTELPIGQLKPKKTTLSTRIKYNGTIVLKHGLGIEAQHIRSPNLKDLKNLILFV